MLQVFGPCWRFRHRAGPKKKVGKTLVVSGAGVELA